MGPDRRQPASSPSKRSAAAALKLFVASALCAGCANPGPPKPPSLHLPAVVKDLVAERAGDQVLLHWTTPSRTTDDMDIKGAMTAQLCRQVGDAPLPPAARAIACAPVQRLTLNSGPSQIVDTLPPALQTEPPTLLVYRLQIFNATGHSAGESAAAYAAAGTAPAAISSLRATASETGAILEWHSSAPTQANAADFVDLRRLDLSPASQTPKAPSHAAVRLPGKNKPSRTTSSGTIPAEIKQQPNEVHLRTADTQSGSSSETSGTLDATAAMGGTYTYVAERVRTVTIGNRRLEIHSAPSPAVTLAMQDTFPPKTPLGLATIPGFTKPSADPANAGLALAPYIDLSWEPNAEPDLAGYRVYRQLARPDGSPQGPLGRLTALPLTAPAYRDVAVRPGQGYIYTVTAVDAAGNESAPSAKALETIPPDAGSSPQ